MALTFLKKKIHLPEPAPLINALNRQSKAGLFPDKGPFWALDTHGVSQGMLMEFLACRERARLGYIEGYTPMGTSNALTFGELFHSTLEGVYKHIKEGKDVTNPKYLESAVRSTLEEYKERINSERVWTPEDEQNHQLNTGYLLILVPAYVKKYFEKDSKQKWLIVEDDFKNKYSIDGMDAILKGRYDQAYQNKHGEVWIKEMKTKGRIDPTIQDRLSFDFQAMFYILNYWLEFQVVPTGFVYDIILRPTLRQKKNENLKSFIERVRRDVDDSYFMRIRMHITPKELDEWVKKDFKPILRDFLTWANGKSETYRNPASCETRYGACKYLRVCGLKDFGGLYRRPHGLLEEKLAV